MQVQSQADQFPNRVADVKGSLILVQVDHWGLVDMAVPDHPIESEAFDSMPSRTWISRVAVGRSAVPAPVGDGDRVVFPGAVVMECRG